MQKLCENCQERIPAERLKILPKTTHCVKCVDQHGEKPVLDPELICSKASISNQNGFSARD